VKFLEKLSKSTIHFDGATGTLLQRAGLRGGQIPELWNIDRPEVLSDIHKGYLLAGADVVSTNTFGANHYKLEGSGFSPESVIGAAVSNCRVAISMARIAEKAAGKPERDMYVSLDLGPSGKLVDVMGDYSFDDAYEMYKEQIIAGVQAGADLILLETFSDPVELKAGILAAKENSNLPIIVSVTFEANGKMLLGTSPRTIAYMFKEIGITALGSNCSLGPKEMLPIIEELIQATNLPVIAQPNAGMPRLEDGEAVYDIGPEEFAVDASKLVAAGAEIIGGCCGTTTEHIAALTALIDSKAVGKRVSKGTDINALACSTSGVVILANGRLDGTKTAELNVKQGELSRVVPEVKKLIKSGAKLIIISAEDSVELPEAVRLASTQGDAPILIKEARDGNALERAVRICRGRPFVAAVKELHERQLEIAAHYGVYIIEV
jgi:5-methyltetrahydrofolate--homocysteine methyltransferase